MCMRGSQLVLPSSPGRSVTFNSHRWSLLQGLKVLVAQRGTVSLGTLAEWVWGWARGSTSQASARGSAPQPLGTRSRISAPLHAVPRLSPSALDSVPQPLGTRSRISAPLHAVPHLSPSARGPASQPLSTRSRISAPLHAVPHLSSSAPVSGLSFPLSWSFSSLVVSNSLLPHGLQYARLSVLHYLLESAQILVR